MIEASRKRIFRRFPCGNMPRGHFLLIHAAADWEGPDGRRDFPTKTCSKCMRTRDVLEFIVGAEVRVDGYTYLVDADMCCDCEGVRHSDYPVTFDGRGRLTLRHAALRDARGEPYRRFDKKRRRWKSWVAAGLRRMDRSASNPDWNHVRLQPYDDRAEGLEKHAIKQAIEKARRQEALFRP